jgi:hypothetical protein
VGTWAKPDSNTQSSWAAPPMRYFELPTSVACAILRGKRSICEFAPGSLVMDMMMPFPVERFEWVGGHRVFKKPGEGRAPYACLPSIDKNLAQHRSQRLVARLQDLKDRGITGVG